MKQSLTEMTESEIRGLSVPVQALWHAAKGAWDRAHELVQDDGSSNAAWVHAYLHRVEGDLGNARYWYRRAGKPAVTEMSLDDELQSLITALTGQ
ncbi:MULTISPECIES: hypothetical protein [unclassified Schlesneria]|uniref:hypothetical protein n=1 Tax=unclassified Schlesneria TaxID=2762017 RepID=UPI002EDEAF29